MKNTAKQRYQCGSKCVYKEGDQNNLFKSYHLTGSADYSV